MSRCQSADVAHTASVDPSAAANCHFSPQSVGTSSAAPAGP
jgi:hypothetical protein